jgi:hypothetical protein
MKIVKLNNVSKDKVDELIAYLESKYFHPLDYDYDSKNLTLKVFNINILNDKNIRELLLICLV